MRASAPCFVVTVSLVLPLAAHCGGAAFDSAPGPGGAGQAGGSGGAPPGTGGDVADASGSGGGGGGSGGVIGTGGGVVTVDAKPPPIDVTPPPPDGSGCAPLAADAKDVYVDQRYVGPSPTGAASCPLPTVLKGLSVASSLPNARTVHVRGASPPLVYGETDAVRVPAGFVLVGDGPAKTTIQVGITPSGAISAVSVDGGGVIDGFTVTCTFGDGIQLAGSSVSPAPIARNVAATGNKGNGIVVLGAADVGPNVSATGNGANGIWAKGDGPLHVIADASLGSNAFDNNGANGINLDGTALLQFDGGTANGNTFNGIRIAASNTAHYTITGLTAHANRNTGVSAFNGENVKIRATSLLANANVGLLYTYGSAGGLDIGADSDRGGNTFGSAVATSRNGKVGVYLCKSRGQGSQPASGNAWAACPPTQVSLSGCDTFPNVYADVAFVPSAPGVPLFDNACTMGP